MTALAWECITYDKVFLSIIAQTLTKNVHKNLKLCCTTHVICYCVSRNLISHNHSVTRCIQYKLQTQEHYSRPQSIHLSFTIFFTIYLARLSCLHMMYLQPSSVGSSTLRTPSLRFPNYARNPFDISTFLKN